MVPDVRITEGNDFQIGFMESEQSKHDSVNKGSAILPSIGCGWWTILNPSLCMKISSQKKVIKLKDFTSSTSVTSRRLRILANFYWDSLKKASSKLVLTLISLLNSGLS